MSTEPQPEPVPAAAVAAAGQLGIDLPALLESFCDRVDLYEHVLKGVAREAVRLKPRIEDLQSQGEVEAARRELHTFKGLCGTVGLAKLSQLAAQAEKAVDGPPAGQTQQALWQALAAAQPGLFTLLGVLAPLAREQAARCGGD